jgi:hypothetical protein
MRLVRPATVSLLLFSSAALAQTAPPPSITAHATAQIAAPLQIQCSAMHFSSLVAQHIATAVTLPPDGSAIVDPGKILIPGATQNAKASSCSVSGDVAATYTVTLPSSTTLTNSIGKTMILNSFTITSDADSNPYSRLLHNDGTGLGLDTFGVGAKLNVGADQPPGTYNGTYVINVQYN